MCDAGSLGQKSSEALITADLFALHSYIKGQYNIELLRISSKDCNIILLPVQTICVVTHTTNNIIVAEVSSNRGF